MLDVCSTYGVGDTKSGNDAQGPRRGNAWSCLPFHGRAAPWSRPEIGRGHERQHKLLVCTVSASIRSYRLSQTKDSER